MDTHRSWQSGDMIVIQEVWNGQLWAAKPVVVVEDRGDFIATWMPRGTVWQCPVTPSNRPKSEDRGERVARLLKYQDWEFQARHAPFSTLSLMRVGDPFAILVGWSEGGELFPSWYVNIQEPFVRQRGGLETMDLTLDVLIDFDGSWRWKDEDELETLVREKAISPAKAGEIVLAGEAAIRRFASKGPPFDEEWLDWKPNPDWPTPLLPVDWKSRY